MSSMVPSDIRIKLPFHVHLNLEACTLTLDRSEQTCFPKPNLVLQVPHVLMSNLVRIFHVFWFVADNYTTHNVFLKTTMNYHDICSDLCCLMTLYQQLKLLKKYRSFVHVIHSRRTRWKKCMLCRRGK